MLGIVESSCMAITWYKELEGTQLKISVEHDNEYKMQKDMKSFCDVLKIEKNDLY